MHKALKPEGWVGLMFAAQTGVDDPLDHAYAQAVHEDPWQGIEEANHYAGPSIWPASDAG